MPNNLPSIEWAVFGLLLFLDFYHNMLFAVMTKNEYNSRSAGRIVMKLVSIPMFSRLGFLNMHFKFS